MAAAGTTAPTSTVLERRVAEARAAGENQVLREKLGVGAGKRAGDGWGEAVQGGDMKALKEEIDNA
eukprot:584158-Prorocentrum_minimum.AAC.1